MLMQTTAQKDCMYSGAFIFMDKVQARVESNAFELNRCRNVFMDWTLKVRCLLPFDGAEHRIAQNAPTGVECLVTPLV